MLAYTRQGSVVRLEDAPLGTGGEGSVYRTDAPRMVAKVYADPAPRQAKIEAMCSLHPEIAGDPRLANVAWPVEALYADPDATGFLGFTMPELEKRISLAALQEFPRLPENDVDKRLEIDALIEYARILQALHDMGQIAGDANDQNVLLLKDGSVGLVDTDSFHVTVDGVLYPCTVCAPDYWAPELLAKSDGATLDNVEGPTFTAETDNHCLAIHVFRSLMNGAHPFGCPPVARPGESVERPALADLIRQGATAYFKNDGVHGVPRYAPAVSSLGRDMNATFKKAFVDGFSDPSARPTAEDWARTLASYRDSLKRCRRDPVHYYSRHNRSCPYCEVGPYEQEAVSERPVMTYADVYQGRPLHDNLQPGSGAKITDPWSPAVWWTVFLGLALAAIMTWMGVLTATGLDFASFGSIRTGQIVAAAIALFAGCALSASGERNLPSLAPGFVALVIVLLLGTVALYFMDHPDQLLLVVGVLFAVLFVGALLWHYRYTVLGLLTIAALLALVASIASCALGT